MDHVTQKFEAIFKHIGEGKLILAEEQLLNLISELPMLPENYHHLLYAYSHLIRIASELRNFDKMSTYISRVKKIPLQSNDDRIRFANCLYSIGFGWSYAGFNDKARENFQACLAIATELNHEELKFACKWSLAEILRMEGKYNEVLKEIENLRNEPNSASKTKNGTILILESDVLRKQGNYLQAIEKLEEAKTIFSRNKNSPSYNYILWAIGTCYATLEDIEKAKIYLDLAQHSVEGVQFWRINILANLTLGELYTVHNQFSDADKCFQKAANICGEDENGYFGRRLMRAQALLQIRQGNYEQASQNLDKLVVVSARENNTREMMRLRLLKAEVLLRTGEAAAQEEARAMLEEAYAYYEENGVIRHQLTSLELLARLDSSTGYPQDALKKVSDLMVHAQNAAQDRTYVKALLAKFVLQRKLGQNQSDAELTLAASLIEKLHLTAESVIFSRFKMENYEQWATSLKGLDFHSQRFVNEFFEDFHFVPAQAMDMEIDQNSHYVREKHLGEIPFYNKFTLMRILCLLAETPGKEFSKEDLAREIWGQEYNPLRHDNNIYININRLRKLVEPNPRENRYIMNGPRGYYFNPSMKVNIHTKIAETSPRLQPMSGRTMMSEGGVGL